MKMMWDRSLSAEYSTLNPGTQASLGTLDALSDTEGHETGSITCLIYWFSMAKTVRSPKPEAQKHTQVQSGCVSR